MATITVGAYDNTTPTIGSIMNLVDGADVTLKGTNINANYVAFFVATPSGDRAVVSGYDSDPAIRYIKAIVTMRELQKASAHYEGLYVRIDEEAYLRFPDEELDDLPIVERFERLVDLLNAPDNEAADAMDERMELRRKLARTQEELDNIMREIGDLYAEVVPDGDRPLVISRLGAIRHAVRVLRRTADSLSKEIDRIGADAKLCEGDLATAKDEVVQIANLVRVYPRDGDDIPSIADRARAEIRLLLGMAEDRRKIINRVIDELVAADATNQPTDSPLRRIDRIVR